MSETDPQTPPTPQVVPTDYDKLQDSRLDKLEADVKKLQEVPVTPPPPQGPQKPSEEGVVKSDRADTNPHNWKSTAMVDRNKKGKWKIVDKKQRRVRTNLSSQAIADQWIAYETHIHDGGVPPVNPPPVDPGQPPVNPPPVDPAGDKDQFGIVKIAPDKPGGRVETGFKLEEKLRNYASGAPSEWSTEYTVDTKTPISEQETTVFVKINGFKDAVDTTSLKILGPAHQDGKGHWYIFQVATDGSSSKNFETEQPHPVYFGNHQKTAFTLGETIVGKWLGLKTVTYLINGGKDRRLEFWLNFPVADINSVDNSKWRQYWAVDDTGQLDHAHMIEPQGSLVTLRIDGTKEGNPPDYKYASVREITAPTTGGTQPPIVPPIEPPVDPGTPPVDPGQPPVSGDVDKFGVKSIYPSTGFRVYDYVLKPNAGLRHNFDAIKSPTPNTEVTGYFSIASPPDDEVSGKWSVTTHSDGNHVKCLDIGVGNKNGAARYRYEDPHPNYTNTLATGSKNGLPLESKFHGWKFIRLTLPDNTVQLEVWQDQGENDGDKPANQWVQLAKWKVDKQYSVVDYPDGVYAVLRLDGSNIEKDLKQKWLSYVEIRPPSS